MPVIVSRILAGGDDCYWTPSSSTYFRNNLAYVYLSWDFTRDVYADAAFRIKLDIPRGATINSAIATICAYTSASSSPSTCNIMLENTDNAAQIISNPDGKTRKANSGSSIAWTIPAFTLNSSYSTPELKTILQPVISRSGWQSGNYINIIMAGTSTRYRQAVAYESASLPELYLTVDYTEILPICIFKKMPN